MWYDKHMRKWVVFGVIVSSLILMRQASAVPYGVSTYGNCEYGEDCTISITTSSSVSLDLSPTVAGVYTIEKDEVTVATNSNHGYSLTLSSSSATENALKNGVEEIVATSGDYHDPIPLGMNEWGYRIDNLGGFGTGPTSSVENQLTNTALFAGIPLLGSAHAIKTLNTASSAPPSDTTTIWYGVRADTSKPAGTYTASVLYTAVVLLSPPED